MSIFVLNIATMLGLALAIDYSLFIVSRFREELRRGRTVGEAVERAVATSGKAVAFSGIAVGDRALRACCCSRRRPSARSGSPGALVVLCSVFFALTFLPAVLGMLGHRVNALSIRGLRHRFRPIAGRPSRPRGPRAGSASPTGSCAGPIARPDPDARVPAHRRQPVPAHGAGRPRRRDLPARRREPRRLRRAPDRVRPGRDHADRHPRRRRRARRRTRANITALTDYAASVDAVEDVDRVEGPFTIHDPADRRAAHARAGRGALRPARGPAPARPRRAARAVRPRQHRPPRRHQPALAVAAGGDRHDPGHPGGRRRRRHHDPGRRQRRDRPRLPRLAGRARARTPSALTLLASGADPVPAVRLGRHPDQGRDHDPALDHRELRRARLDLPGGQPLEPAGLRAARLHHRGQPDHHVQRDLRAVDGLRGPAALADPGGATGGPATTPRRSPRAWPRRPASSPARR